jgi:hypothetical protein
MKTTFGLTSVLAICCLCRAATCAEQAGAIGEPNDVNEPAVAIELTRLEISESFLALDFKTRNASDDDVWVCSAVSSTPLEVFLTQDRQTLLIRRRLEVPSTAIWHRPPFPGTYVRLGPGEDRPESLLIDLPVAQQTVFAGLDTSKTRLTIRRLAVEIGYYDEDLPALVRRIFEATDKLTSEDWDIDGSIYRTYFRGFVVRSALSGFGIINKDPYGEGRVLIDYSRGALTGEKVLKLEVSGVAIPYVGSMKK